MAKRVIGRLHAREVATKPPGKHSDGGNLWLFVRESGSRSWVFRWMFHGHDENMGLGSYPDVSLAEAREAAHECRKLVKQGKDPRKVRAQKSADEKPKPTFGEFSRDWLNRTRGNCAKDYFDRSARELRLHVNPVKLENSRTFESLTPDEIGTNEVVAVLNPIWWVKNPTAVDVRQMIEQILDAAKALEYRTGENPARWRGHLATYFPKPSSIHRRKHHPSLPYQHAPTFIAQLRPGRTTDDALRTLVHIVVRVSVVCLAEWTEVDWENHKLLVPRDRIGIKGLELPNDIFEVPLPDPVMRMLKERYRKRVSKFIFPSRKRGQPIGKEALLYRAKQLATLEITDHGFRATFRTWADKRTICEKEPKEMILGHTIGNETENAYARDDWLEKRRLLLEVWSDFLISGVDRVVDINAMFLRRFGSESRAGFRSSAARVPISMIGDDTPVPQFRRVAFIDLEASGLGSTSFPTEIGWAVVCEDGAVESGSVLIQPPAIWTTYANAWSGASEHLTGITREMLDHDGLPPSVALKRFLDAVEDRHLYTDAPDFDVHWLAMLAAAAGRSINGLDLGDAKKLIEQMGMPMRFGEPPQHRAEADARRLALAYSQAITVRPQERG